MNAKKLFASVALLAATGSVFAEASVAPDAGFVSTRTRAEVAAEVKQAYADGNLGTQQSEFVVFEAPNSSKTRAEVREELADDQIVHRNTSINSVYFGA